jgi:hypothetical protein
MPLPSLLTSRTVALKLSATEGTALPAVFERRDNFPELNLTLRLDTSWLD